jgi:hypothetical protein
MSTNPRIPGDLFARAQMIVGLRKLAGYLEDHPELPVPDYGGDVTVYPNGTEAEQRAEIDRIADILGVNPTDNTGRDGHYTASKSFARITYRAVYIPSRAWAKHRALNSYRPNITVDPDQGDYHQGQHNDAAA